MNWQHEPGRIYLLHENGALAAEVTFPCRNGVAIINHTFVDPALRGQGIASQLLEEVTRTLVREGWKARPTCSYARRWFDTHPQWSHLLADPQPAVGDPVTEGN